MLSVFPSVFLGTLLYSKLVYLRLTVWFTIVLLLNFVLSVSLTSELIVHFLYLPPRITYVQSTPGIPSTLPLVSTTTGSSTTQQALPVAGSAYVPSALATLGFTTIAPPGQTLVQPLITG